VVRSLPVFGYAAIVVFDLDEAKGYGMGISMTRQGVNDWSSGVSQSQQLCHFVEGFASGVVAGTSDVFVNPAVFPLLRQEKMRVSTGDHQCQQRKVDLEVPVLPLFQQYSMDVAFQ